jgi:hypothetical protein
MHGACQASLQFNTYTTVAIIGNTGGGGHAGEAVWMPPSCGADTMWHRWLRPHCIRPQQLHDFPATSPTKRPDLFDRKWWTPDQAFTAVQFKRGPTILSAPGQLRLRAGLASSVTCWAGWTAAHFLLIVVRILRGMNELISDLQFRKVGPSPQNGGNIWAGFGQVLFTNLLRFDFGPQPPSAVLHVCALRYFGPFIYSAGLRPSSTPKHNKQEILSICFLLFLLITNSSLPSCSGSLV